jgi:hypothetical protein
MADSISPVAVGFFVFIALWLVGLTYYFYMFITHFNNLLISSDKRSLQSVFEKAVDEARSSQEKVEVLGKRLEILEKKGQKNIQKISLNRFNPFSNTGGEQSFIVALLDEHDSGIVFTSLQSRSGTRWYAKQVIQGKGVDFDLSKEEKEAIIKAKPLI